MIRATQTENYDDVSQSLEAEASAQAARWDRRKVRRQQVSAPVEVQPLDSGLAPLAEPRNVLAVDMSREGLGLLGDIPASAKYLYVWVRRGDRILAEGLYQVAHHDAFGPCARVGCRLVSGKQPNA